VWEEKGTFRVEKEERNTKSIKRMFRVPFADEESDREERRKGKKKETDGKTDRL
jgi:hypothetical protein